MHRKKMIGLLQRFQANDPALQQDIEGAERALAMMLPVEYKEFVLFANGGECFIANNSYAMTATEAMRPPETSCVRTQKACPPCVYG